MICKLFSSFLVFPLLATALLAQGQEVSPASLTHIDQAGSPILYAADFIVAEDGVIFISDGKDGNLKSYDAGGKLLMVIGRRGPGPEEFMAPYFCDYQEPYLSVLDAFKIKIYERKGRVDLAKVAEIPCMACTSDVILSRKGVLVDAVINDNGRKIFLSLRGFPGEFIKYLLPIERRYGYESERSYKANLDDFTKLTSQKGFLSVAGDRVYFVFDARPIVTSVNLDGSGVARFICVSPNYREPRINAIIRDAFFKPGRGGEIQAERKKVSYITGILADDRMIGVLFSNYDAASEMWKLYLQRYDAAGKLVSECLLRGAVNYGNLFSYFYQRGSGTLYVMAEEYGEETDDYRILGYKLR